MATQAHRVNVRLFTGEEIVVSWEMARALLAAGLAELAGTRIECAVQTKYETR